MSDGAIDLDDLKAAWQQLDRRLARHEAIALDGLRHRRLDGVRAHLRPLRWGQRVQIPLGVVVVVWAVWTWRTHWDVMNVRVAAIVMHTYGAALILAGVRTLALLDRLDYGAPVLEIQRRLATVQRWYGQSGLVLGMAWWLLWLPALVMLAGAFGIDLLARAPRVLGGYVAACSVGLLASLWLVRWAEQSRRPAVRAWAERAAAGDSLFRAVAALDEIRRFESDDPDRPAH
jgi:hypothetical protein